ncbi:MAG: trimethylamine methyltransferase family protein [Deltaproteobacteria bacterium]|nr:trimethylamine methyltransferase family protein [Deltaproteobacteria bacterium]
MPLKKFTVEKPFEILSEAQVEMIHCATLEILETTGLVFEHDKALEVLDGAGCRVERASRRVYFPPHLVERSLRSCPSSFSVRTREPHNDLRFGGRTLLFMPWAAMDATDLATGARVVPTTEAETEAVRLMDALDVVHAHYGAYFNFEGIHPMMSMPIKTSIGLRNSSKLQSTVAGFDWDLWQIKMGQATGQEMLGTPTGSPPLTWGEPVVESVFRYVEADFPIFPTSGQVFGGSAPATLAGALALNNAELMAILVLTQVLRPGHRFVAADYSQPLGMRSGQALLGAIENGLTGMAFTQMWRHYEIPCALAANGSDSKLPDYQCAYEKSMNAVTQCMAGPNLFLSGGSVYDELTWSPTVMVMDAEVHEMVGRIVTGIEVSEETLAVDLIRQVGPIPGFYLDKKHTRDWWRREQFIPELADRQSHAEWEASGAKGILERAQERLETLLKNHEPTPLPQDQCDALDEILVEAEAHYRQHDMM